MVDAEQVHWRENFPQKAAKLDGLAVMPMGRVFMLESVRQRADKLTDKLATS
ncbi:MAG: hypothetical protein NTV49_05265 [Kiritimatiellaeota bacterium]|nr:hypothetical protein [Kiritimatiellota bacterium]